MNYPASEKLEIIRLVEHPHLSVKRALGKTVDATKLAQRRRLVAAELSEASVVSAPELPLR